jgi:hypothetical protein
MWYFLCVSSCCFVCFCLVIFYLGPGCYLIFPLMEVSPRHWTQRVSEETDIWKLSSAIWNFQQTVLYREYRAWIQMISWPDWLSASSIHQCNFHSSNNRISKKANCVYDPQCIQCQRYDSYIQGLSLLWVQFEPCYVLEASQHELWTWCSARRIAEYPVCIIVSCLGRGWTLARLSLVMAPHLCSELFPAVRGGCRLLFLLSATGPCPELLFGRLGQLLNFSP